MLGLTMPSVNRTSIAFALGFVRK